MITIADEDGDEVLLIQQDRGQIGLDKYIEVGTDDNHVNISSTNNNGSCGTWFAHLTREQTDELIKALRKARRKLA